MPTSRPDPRSPANEPRRDEASTDVPAASRPVQPRPAAPAPAGAPAPNRAHDAEDDQTRAGN